MIIDRTDTTENIVKTMYEYMLNEGFKFDSKWFRGSSSYAILGGKTSIGYRAKSKKWPETGIVFFCAKDGIDMRSLERGLGLKVYDDNDKDPTRPYAVFVPDDKFEMAVELLRNNPNNIIPGYEKVVCHDQYEMVKAIDKTKQIYLVKDIETGIRYVKKEYKNYDENVIRILKESKFIGIPRIIKVSEKNGVLTTVEEYIEGKNLLEVMNDKGTFDESEVKEICMKLCDIVHQLHSLTPPLIHRDIKPSNIMLKEDGTVVLIDFNTVKEYHSGNSQDTVFAGTMEFEAPEQHGYGQSIPPTDIYGIGATMSYLLTGNFARNIIAPGKFKSIWKKCISLDCKDRYQSAQELKQALIDINI